MSTGAAAADEVCASCGTAAVDDVKLKDCDGGCDLVKYCSDPCEVNHREQHNKMCKKRCAELRDNDLFTQPDESHYGECPICCLPLSLDIKKSTLMSCCCNMICNGCEHANLKREYEAGLEHRCAFCREPMPDGDEKFYKNVVKRIKKNDPVALSYMGKKHDHEGDYKGALEYLTKAAELGDAYAHYELSRMYHRGEGVDRDKEKYIYHLEEAAIGGHPTARHNLGIEEMDNGKYERARKHFIIAANLGYHNSLEGLRQLYEDGHASKEDYANALRAYQASLEATESEEREAGEAYFKVLDAARLNN